MDSSNDIPVLHEAIDDIMQFFCTQNDFSQQKNSDKIVIPDFDTTAYAFSPACPEKTFGELGTTKENLPPQPTQPYVPVPVNSFSGAQCSMPNIWTSPNPIPVSSSFSAFVSATPVTLYGAGGGPCATTSLTSTTAPLPRVSASHPVFTPVVTQTAAGSMVAAPVKRGRKRNAETANLSEDGEEVIKLTIDARTDPETD